MARIRCIKPDFFRHEALFEAERASGLPLRVAFAGLLTVADREGRFRWRPRQLKLDVLPFDDVDFGKVLAALEAGGFLQRYCANGDDYGCFPSWHKHQIVNNRETASAIPAPPDKAARGAPAVVASATGDQRDDHETVTPLVQEQGEGEGEREGKEVSEEAIASSSSSATTRRPTIPCPYNAIVDAYHRELPNLPKVKLRDGPAWTDRQKAMRTLWGWVLSSRKSDGERRAETGDQALAWVTGYFARARENDFVMGRTPRGPGHENWRADFDFLLSKKGVKQVIEKTLEHAGMKRDDAPLDDRDIARLRVPPHSAEAEQSVLGALLLDNSAWDLAGDLLTESDFYRYEHKAIYKAIGDLVQATKPADVITVYEQLQLHGKAEECGGIAYLNALAQSVPSAGHVRAYAERVRDHAVRRRLIEAADEIATEALNPQLRSTQQLLDRAQTLVLQIGEQDQRDRSGFQDFDGLMVQFIDRVTELHERGDAVTGVRTGIEKIDSYTAGMQPGDFIVLAARPSVGKTSLAMAIAECVAVRERLPVIVFSMEMGAAQLVPRVLAAKSGIDHDRLRTGRLSNDDWSRLSQAMDEMQGASLHIDETPALTSASLRARARRQARKCGRLGLIVIDYLQLMAGSGRGRDTNRTAELDEISRDLKALAKELQCPVLALSQLNRNVETRAVKRPTLPDLRDSGGIEQAVDVALMLWHVRDVEPEGIRIVGVAVEKNRNGPRGEFGLAFHGATQRWRETNESIYPRQATSASGGGFE